MFSQNISQYPPPPTSSGPCVCILCTSSCVWVHDGLLFTCKVIWCLLPVTDTPTLTNTFFLQSQKQKTMTKARCHICLFLLLLVSITLEHLRESCWGTLLRLHLVDHFKGCLCLSSPNDLSASDVQRVPSPWRPQTCFFGNKLVHVLQCSSALCLTGSSLSWPASEKRTPTSPCWSCPRIDERKSRRMWLKHQLKQQVPRVLQWSASKQQSTLVPGPRLGRSMELLFPDWDCDSSH